MFFSTSSPQDVTLLRDMGLKDILVSYFYLRKRQKIFEEKVLPEIKESGGLFMTDSGGFSFISGEVKDEFYTESYWLPYLEEYVAWLYANHKYIYVAANLDVDAYVGRETIVKWNKKYFKPLEKYVQIVYVAQRDWNNEYGDYHGLKRFKEYCSLYDYVGVNKNYASNYVRVATIARHTKTRLHGFAWTSIPRLMSKPMFSVDSTSWLSGIRYGTTYIFNGANFVSLDAEYKYLRKWKKLLVEKHGIDYEGLLNEDREAVNRFNLIAWKGASDKYIKLADTKLWNKDVLRYAKNK